MTLLAKPLTKRAGVSARHVSFGDFNCLRRGVRDRVKAVWVRVVPTESKGLQQNSGLDTVKPLFWLILAISGKPVSPGFSLKVVPERNPC